MPGDVAQAQSIAEMQGLRGGQVNSVHLIGWHGIGHGADRFVVSLTARRRRRGDAGGIG